MRKLIAIMVLLLGAVQAPASPVWVASNGDNTVYLGGTIHMLRESDYPLPDPFYTAYAAADVLVFETDISVMDQPGAQMGMLQQLMYTDGRTLQTVLNDEAYTALTDYVAGLGLPMMMLQNMKPGMLMSSLEVMAFQQLGFMPQGVDLYFYERAGSDGKDIDYLESVQQQVEFVAELGEGEESDYVLLSLSDLEELEVDIDGMVETWRQGDSALMMESFVDDMQESAPDSYELLLSGRNTEWMTQIEAMLADSDTEYVLVGVAHLLGEDGLVEMLRARGYRVNQL